MEKLNFDATATVHMNEKTSVTPCPSCASVQTELSSIKQQMAQCLAKLDSVITSQAKTAVVMKELLRRKEKTTVFPITKVDEVLSIDKEIGDYVEKYRPILKPLLRGPLIKCLPKIIEPKVLLDFNYRGLKNKMCFKDLNNLNDAIFNCIAKEGYTKDDYQKDIQYAFSRIKNNFFKSACIKKGKENVEINN